jgi:hypothetical protein
VTSPRLSSLKAHLTPAAAEAEHRESIAEDLEEFLYGTITALVAISALNGTHAPSTRNAFVVIFGTAIATWLAHAFSTVIGVHVRERRPASLGEVWHAFRKSVTVVTAAAPATILVILTGFNVLAMGTALSIATALAILALIGVAVIAAVSSGFNALGVLLYSLIATGIGLLIAAIEIAIHH